MTNFSMSWMRRPRPRAGSLAWRLASVTAISVLKFAPRRPRCTCLPQRATFTGRGCQSRTCKSARRSRSCEFVLCNAIARRRKSASVRDTLIVRPDPIAYTLFVSRPSEARSLALRTHVLLHRATLNCLRGASLGALRLTRSFLLLEDDYDVDWEVDRDEPRRARSRSRDRRVRAVARSLQRRRRRVGTAAPAPATRASRPRPRA